LLEKTCRVLKSLDEIRRALDILPSANAKNVLSFRKLSDEIRKAKDIL